MPGTGCDLSTKAKGIDRGQREGVAGGVKMERGFRSSEGSGHQISGESLILETRGPPCCHRHESVRGASMSKVREQP